MPGNERFDREEIVRAHREAAIRRIAGYGGMILAVRDATGVNNTHVKTEGIGYINDKTLGSTSIAAWRLPQMGWFFGGLDQSSYNREEAKNESARGYGGRKSEELFAKAQSLDEPVLIRIVQNRMTVENRRILDEIRKERCGGRVEATLPRDSRNGRRCCR
jgi:hypothetical protein